MLNELELVVLTRDVPDCGLKAGDVGAIAHRYADGRAYEVEFVTAEGRTIAVITLTEKDVRSIRDKEILHVREYAA